MDDYEFEEFKSQGSRSSIVITLGKAERFYFGGFMTQKYKLLSLTGMKLLYDKKRNAIGFKLINETEDGMVGIKKMQGKSTYINAKAFLGMYDIDALKYEGRYHPKEITSGDGKKILVIELVEKK